MPVESCRECGKYDKAYYIEERKAEMEERSLCFKCLFWTQYLEDPRQNIVVKGRAYTDAGAVDLSKRRGFTGFGGSLFTIHFFTGATLKTNNLWHRGDVPGHFRDRLPDNAEFNYETAKSKEE